jgi:hypothetical protein
MSSKSYSSGHCRYAEQYLIGPIIYNKTLKTTAPKTAAARSKAAAEKQPIR